MSKWKRKSDKNPEDPWDLKQRAAAPGRYYGGNGTIHCTVRLDVETHHGTVVAVWFRCQMLPFIQHEVDGRRATEMESVSGLPFLTGVEVEDQIWMTTSPQ